MATTYLKRLPASNGSNTTGTLSAWIKREAIGSAQCAALAGQEGTDANNRLFFGFWSDDTLALQIVNGGTAYEQSSVAVFRDPSAWYHIVARLDTSNGVAQDRIKLYVNGTQITTYTTNDTFPSSVDIKLFENTTSCETLVGARKSGASYNNISGGSMSHVHVIDGTAYDASTFGETDATSGIWKIKTSPTVTYGTNGFFLKFEDRTNLDLDSGTNTFTDFVTAGTLTATYDSPSNNFCTWNPNNKSHNQTYTFENGNTVALIPSASGWAGTSGTLAAGAGKWYMEGKVNYTPGGVNTTCGFASNRAIACKTAYGQLGYVDKGSVDDYAPSFGVYDNGDLLYATTSAVSQSTGSWATAWVSGDIIMVAIDIDNGKFYFGANGTWDAGASNDPAAGTGGYTFTPDGFLYTPITTIYQGRLEMNFGNGYFSTTAIGSPVSYGEGLWKYTPPTDYRAMCTKNLVTYG